MDYGISVRLRALMTPVQPQREGVDEGRATARQAAGSG
jgi:hypothetical protein